MAKKNDRKSMSVYWPETLIAFTQKQVFNKTRMVQSYSTELAMEQYLKSEGMWEAYVESCLGEYKGYTPTIVPTNHPTSLRGKLKNVDEEIAFAGDTIEYLLKDFHAAVDEITAEV